MYALSSPDCVWFSLAWVYGGDHHDVVQSLCGMGGLHEYWYGAHKLLQVRRCTLRAVLSW